MYIIALKDYLEHLGKGVRSRELFWAVGLGVGQGSYLTRNR
jgi:hypothetical protein